MSLWRNQARLEIRKMKAIPEKRRSTLSAVVQNSKAAQIHNSKISARLRRIAKSLRIVRQSSEDVKAQTMLAVSYSSTTLGQQPRMIPSFLTMPLPGGAHKSPKPMLPEAKIKPSSPAPILLAPKPAINVIKATPESHKLSQSEASSIISTPTKKPLPHPVPPPLNPHRHGHKRSFAVDSKIPAPHFLGQSEQNEANKRPTSAPRSIAKAVKPFNHPARQNKRFCSIWNPSQSSDLALRCNNPEVQTKVQTIQVLNHQVHHPTAHKQQLKEQKVAAKFDDKLLKAREDVARRRASNASTQFGESKRASMASFLSARSKGASQRSSWTGSLRDNHHSHKHAHKRLPEQQELKPPPRLTGASKYKNAPPALASKAPPESPLFQKPLPMTPDADLQLSMAKEDQRLKRLGQYHFRSDPSLAYATAPAPLSHRHYKIRSASENNMPPRSGPEEKPRQQALNSGGRQRAVMKGSTSVAKYKPLPPSPLPMEKVVDVFGLMYAYDEKTAKRIQKRNADTEEGQKGREMLGLEREESMRSSVIGPATQDATETVHAFDWIGV